MYCSCSLPHSVEEERLLKVKQDAETQARFQVWLDTTYPQMNYVSSLPPQVLAQLRGGTYQLSGFDMNALLGGGVVRKEMPKG